MEFTIYVNSNFSLNRYYSRYNAFFLKLITYSGRTHVPLQILRNIFQFNGVFWKWMNSDFWRKLQNKLPKRVNFKLLPWGYRRKTSGGRFYGRNLTKIGRTDAGLSPPSFAVALLLSLPFICFVFKGFLSFLIRILTN